jgi:hypothetical protein
LALECKLPFTPAWAPFAPIPEFTVPFKLAAGAAVPKPKARAANKKIAVPLMVISIFPSNSIPR